MQLYIFWQQVQSWQKLWKSTPVAASSKADKKQSKSALVPPHQSFELLLAQLTILVRIKLLQGQMIQSTTKTEKMNQRLKQGQMIPSTKTGRDETINLNMDRWNNQLEQWVINQKLKPPLTKNASSAAPFYLIHFSGINLAHFGKKKFHFGGITVHLMWWKQILSVEKEWQIWDQKLHILLLMICSHGFSLCYAISQCCRLCAMVLTPLGC